MLFRDITPNIFYGVHFHYFTHGHFTYLIPNS